MDYGFTHQGKVYTPNGTGISPAESEARNKEIEAKELATWQTRPDGVLAYYRFPAEQLPLFGRPRVYRATFHPLLHSYVENGLANVATVSTWLGTTIGTITSARVYRHNFGSRMVAMTVKGTNGATYHGRASWDNGTCIRLRLSKP